MIYSQCLAGEGWRTNNRRVWTLGYDTVLLKISRIFCCVHRPIFRKNIIIDSKRAVNPSVTVRISPVLPPFPFRNSDERREREVDLWKLPLFASPSDDDENERWERGGGHESEINREESRTEVFLGHDRTKPSRVKVLNRSRLSASKPVVKEYPNFTVQRVAPCRRLVK
jgi:hypothetical protein